MLKKLTINFSTVIQKKGFYSKIFGKDFPHHKCMYTFIRNPPCEFFHGFDIHAILSFEALLK